MSEYEDVVACAAAAGLPCAHMAWPKGSAPPLPWCTYYLESRSGSYADGVAYAPVSEWVLELYQASRDAAAEAALERSISESFGAFSKSEAWVESEGCTQTSYRFSKAY